MTANASVVITPGSKHRRRGKNRKNLQPSASENLPPCSASKRPRSSIMEVDENRRQTLLQEFFCVRAKPGGTAPPPPPPSSREGTGATRLSRPVSDKIGGPPAGSPLQRIDANTGRSPPSTNAIRRGGGSAAGEVDADGRSAAAPCCVEGASPDEEASLSASSRLMSEVPCGRQTPVVEREEMTRCTPRKEAKGGGGQGKQRRYQQLYLDLGQRDFAQRQICGMCGMMVVHGVEEDIKEHERICRDYTVGIAFHSETARAVASPNKDSTVYQIRPGDSQALWKKVAQVRAIVDQELGFVPDPEESNSSSTFLYTRKKRVIGLCTVLPIRRGYALSACNSERSTQARKAAIGVHQLWIHSKFRREGVATALLDAAREKMYFGLVVPAAQVAFSSPTLAGALFARRYVSMSSGSSDVLVYDVNRVAT